MEKGDSSRWGFTHGILRDSVPSSGAYLRAGLAEVDSHDEYHHPVHECGNHSHPPNPILYYTLQKGYHSLQ